MSSATSFNCKEKYQNNLPQIPCGPYFRDVNLSLSFQDFATYKISSLERSYIWQPHLGPDVGIKLNLVDQEAILCPEDKTAVLDPSESRYLTGTGERGRVSRVKDEKPAWLRNTTYLDNDLFGSGPRKGVSPRQKKFEMADNIKAQISTSFSAVEETLAMLQKKTGRKLLWSSSVLPDFSMWGNSLTVGFFEDRVVGEVSVMEDAEDAKDDTKADVMRRRFSFSFQIINYTMYYLPICYFSAS